MKKDIFLLLFFILFSSTSFAQQEKWLQTDSMEFVKLYSQFPGVKLNKKIPPPFSTEFKNFKEVGLSKGVWEGKASFIDGGDNFELVINQIEPLIKGIFMVINPQIESTDTVFGNLIGKQENGKVILAFHIPAKDSTINDSFANLEGKCYSYDWFSTSPAEYGIRYYNDFLGKIESSDKSNYFGKGFFKFSKREK